MIGKEIISFSFFTCYTYIVMIKRNKKCMRGY